MSFLSNSLFFAASSFDPPDVATTTSRRQSRQVLLDKVAYLANRSNGTTAESFGRTGQAVEVSFWLTDPPGLSHFCVHCPGLNKTHFAEEPLVVCAEEDVAVLQVYFTFGPKDHVYERGIRDYFVYRAHRQHPSLDLLPTPSPHFFQPHEFGLLPCVVGGGEEEADFTIAVLRPRVVVPHEYDLHVFSSNTWTWSSKLALLDPRGVRAIGDFMIHVTDKVFTLAGDTNTLGFVDVRHGVLLCRTHQGTPDLWHIGLPAEHIKESNTNRERYRSLVRDFTFSDDAIRFIEVAEWKRQVVSESSSTAPKCSVCARRVDSADLELATDGWNAIAWSRSTNADDRWIKDYEVCADDIAISNPSHLDLLPDLRAASESRKSTLNRNLVAVTATLSMHDKDVFHLACKVNDMDKTAWILSINMRNKSLEDIAPFSADRVHFFNPPYRPCALSENFNMVPHKCEVGCKRKRRDEDAENAPVDTTILMHGLDPFTSSDQLRSLFTMFGDLHDFNIAANQQYASIQFVSRSCAEKAMRMLNGAQGGRLKFDLSWGSNSPNKQPSQPNVNKSGADSERHS
ncbi:hypothetical protein EJB05_08035, partial [Eragrostis curvula]